MMPPDDRTRDFDVVLDPTQYAHILDSTKGTVICHVGPTRLDLADKDKPVWFHEGKFERCSRIDEAIRAFPVAAEGDYIVLTNPAKNGSHPDAAKGNSAVELDVGRTVIVRGPTTFPLWPGQEAKVIRGHRLRSNQYLVARVINEDDAKKNWSEMVARPNEESSSPKKEEDGETTQDAVKAVMAEGLTLGKEIVIKGTEVSFFIPPTGVEVVQAEQSGLYIRDAVTLERLEYCILVDEDGNKRFERGPQVVFPRPTEKFVTTVHSKDEVSRKFRAVELNEINGIHVKVIADYSEKIAEVTTEYNEGDELFITGKEQKIYFPRPEHAIIKYGNQERHFAVAIPEGEARYVLDRMTGKITTRRGPDMALLDPRKEVFVRRIVDPKIVQLWFPGNAEALSYNRKLSEYREGSSQYARERSVGKSFGTVGASMAAARGLTGMLDSEALLRALNYAGDAGDVQESYAQSERAVSEIAGDEITRKEKFTPPRAITLDNTKYEGAVLINVWTGYAVQVVGKTGNREVVVGPQPRLLDYDESLEAVSLSTGTPKSFNDPLRTVYLRVTNNRVSDEITAETADLVRVRVRLAMRVNFDGDNDKWFSVENYVGLLTERVRSILHSRIKQVKIREFMNNSVAMIRDFLIGTHPEESEGSPRQTRPGLRFSENNMHLYDVEVLEVQIGNGEIDSLLQSSQHDTVHNEIELERSEQQLVLAHKKQVIERELIVEKEKTELAGIQSARKIADETATSALAQVQRGIEKSTEELTLTRSREEIEDERAKRTDARDKIRQDREIEHQRALEEIVINGIKERGAVVIDKIKAITPDLTAAMQVLGDKMLTTESIKELGAVAALTGESVEGVFKRLMQGSVLADVFISGEGNKAGLVAKAVERAGLGLKRPVSSE